MVISRMLKDRFAAQADVKDWKDELGSDFH
jgi:hypothetical protein